MNLAIIPARGGSKRIPRKNIKEFHGKPLIGYSIEVVKKSGIFDKIIVSTDDPEIAEISRRFGAETPFIRPKELSDDFTGTDAVTEHALEFFKKEKIDFNFVCTIYATAPFLQSKYLEEGLKKLKESDAINSFSATSFPFPIQRGFKVLNDRCEMFQSENYSVRSQDLEEAFHDAGQFYWKKVGRENGKILFSKSSIPIILPRYLVQDIDTLEDWKRAELMFEVLKNS